jgi:hypothetical protein
VICVHAKLLDVVMPPDAPCFFLSYARADADEYFERFYEDFRNELRGQLGRHTVDGLAFRDSDDISLGELWKPGIERALLACRTFFAMLSPTYLERPECRREWAGFEWRLARYGPAGPPHLLLPVMWRPIPDHKLPPAIQQRQYKHARLGAAYASRGLRYLARRRGSSYHDFLEALAEDMCAAMGQPALPPASSLPAPDQLGDPFAIASPPSTVIPAVAPARTGGPGYVEFIVVAGSETEIRAVRQAVAAYGAGIDDWCPYLPAREDRATVLVQEIALQEKFSTGRTSVPQDIVAHVERARDSNTLVVLVVDAWSLCSLRTVCPCRGSTPRGWSTPAWWCCGTTPTVRPPARSRLSPARSRLPSGTSEPREIPSHSTRNSTRRMRSTRSSV